MRISEQKMYDQEAEIRPNRYVALALTWLSFFIIGMLLINELGIFHVAKDRMRFSVFAALIILIIPLFATGTDTGLRSWKTKYLMIGCVGLAVAILCTVLNFHATLILVLPTLLAAQYPSEKMARIAIACSAVCAFITPPLSYLLGMWDPTFLTWLSGIVGLKTIPGAATDQTVNLMKILLYLSAPHTLIILAFYPLSSSIAHSGEQRLNNQIQVLHMGESDALTGLLNRRSFERAMVTEAPARAGEVSVAYVDANNLHKINVEQGHSEGDRMLICVAENLTSVFGNESVYRTGGDEFVSIVYRMSLAEVQEAISKVKAEVERNGYGVAVGIEHAELPCTLPALMKAAEAKMLMDKEHYHIVR